MKTITITRTIFAPVDVVFQTIADIRNFSAAVPDIIDITFLTEQQTGTGTRFKEVREINGKKTVNELEVTEYVANDHFRIIANTHGTLWDSLFTVGEAEDYTTLRLELTAESHSLLSKIANPIMKPFIRKAIENDMDAVKAYCENQS